MSKTLSTVRLIDLLPQNLKTTEIIALSEALAEGVSIVLESIDKLKIDVDNASDEILDILAYSMHVDFYNSSMNVELKRNLIKNSFNIHLKKGTPSAVEDLISMLFGSGIVEEWWEYGGEPHHFRILTTNEDVNNSLVKDFVKALDTVKRKSSWLDTVILQIQADIEVYYSATVQTVSFQTINS